MMTAVSGCGKGLSFPINPGATLAVQLQAGAAMEAAVIAAAAAAAALLVSLALQMER